MEATRKRKPSYCVHTTEDGIECKKSVQHYPEKLCRRHQPMITGFFGATVRAAIQFRRRRRRRRKRMGRTRRTKRRRGAR